MDKISKSQVKLVRSLQQKKFRDELHLFVAEGEKCVSELLKGFELEMLVVEEGLELNQSLLCQAKPVCTLSAKRSDIEQMSGLKTPQGVIAVFKKALINHQSPITNDLSLALDAIQDPGNLGTIIRTCDWFGVHDIYCSQDTADCYNPKVVQATMGALARVRLHYVDLPQWLAEIKQSSIINHQSTIAIFGTLLDGQNMYEVLQQRGLTAERSFSDSGLAAEGGHAVIVMGNEGNGISAPVRQLITHPIRIPSYLSNGAAAPDDEASEVVESLNVSIATAIVLAEFRRLSAGL